MGVLAVTPLDDARTHSGPVAVRLPGKSMRAARIRRNRLALDAGQALRPRWHGVVRTQIDWHSNWPQKKVVYEYDPRWRFWRGDAFPKADHRPTCRYYGDSLG